MTWFGGGSLRARLVTSLSAVALVAVLVVGATAWLVGSSLQSGLARAAANDEADGLADALSAADPADRTALVRAYSRLGDLLFVAEREGVEVARSDALASLQEPLPAWGPAELRPATVGARGYLVATRSVDEMGLWLFVPADRLQGSRENLAAALLVASGLAMVLCTGLVILLGRRLLAPVDRTVEAAHELARGAMGTRVDDVEHRRGFADLTGGFNEMAAALEHTIWELEQSEARQRRFVADVSHELRTPLTVLTASADLLRPSVPRLEGPARRAAELLIDEVAALAILVDDLMQLARLDSGQAAMQVDSVDVDRLIHDVLGHRRWEEQVEVQARSDPPIVVDADPRRLGVVIANLVGNALAHGEKPVTIRFRERAGMVEIDVRDHGPGIPPDHRERVFHRFHKVDAARTRGSGSGLGLAIARDNARLLGGDIAADCPPSGGTTMRVVLPRPAPPEPGEGA